MHDNTLPYEVLASAVEQIGHEFDEVIREQNDGGFGLVLPDDSAIPSLGLCFVSAGAERDLAEEGAADYDYWLEVARELMSDARVEGLGRRVVVTFPGWTLDLD